MLQVGLTERGAFACNRFGSVYWPGKLDPEVSQAHILANVRIKPLEIEVYQEDSPPLDSLLNKTAFLTFEDQHLDLALIQDLCRQQAATLVCRHPHKFVVQVRHFTKYSFLIPKSQAKPGDAMVLQQHETRLQTAPTKREQNFLPVQFVKTRLFIQSFQDSLRPPEIKCAHSKLLTLEALDCSRNVFSCGVAQAAAFKSSLLTKALILRQSKVARPSRYSDQLLGHLFKMMATGQGQFQSSEFDQFLEEAESLGVDTALLQDIVLGRKQHGQLMRQLLAQESIAVGYALSLWLKDNRIHKLVCSAMGKCQFGQLYQLYRHLKGTGRPEQVMQVVKQLVAKSSPESLGLLLGVLAQEQGRPNAAPIYRHLLRRVATDNASAIVKTAALHAILQGQSILLAHCKVLHYSQSGQFRKALKAAKIQSVREESWFYLDLILNYFESHCTEQDSQLLLKVVDLNRVAVALGKRVPVANRVIDALFSQQLQDQGQALELLDLLEQEQDAETRSVLAGLLARRLEEKSPDWVGSRALEDRLKQQVKGVRLCSMFLPSISALRVET